MAIVKANYRPRARVAGIGRSVAYYTWREHAGVPAAWYSSDGRELSYETARREVTEQAHEASYTYRIVLSTRDTPLEAEDYAQILDAQFNRWYLATHHAGEHPHAHAIAFSDHRLDVGHLTAMREQLRELEIDRERELEQVRAHDWSW